MASLALGATLSLACGASPEEANQSVGEQQGDALACGRSETTGRPEFYMVDAIQRKLDYYPELASYAGLSRVTTCAEGRAFRTAYFEYSMQNPGFDADQPLADLPDFPEPEPGEDPDLEIEKLLGGKAPGWTFPTSPVVKLTELVSGDEGECTGTFIAKRWILTAGHCLAQVSKVKVPDGQETAKQVKGYGKFKVEWPNPDGTVITGTNAPTLIAKKFDMLQIPHDNFMGSEFPDDLALIYLNNDKYDQLLPARMDQGAAMRISLRAPAISSLPATPAAELTFAAGFGDPTGDLRVAEVFPDELPASHPVTGVQMPRTFGADILYPPPSPGTDGTPPANTQPVMCEGDSGGPVFRTGTPTGATDPVRIEVGSLIGTRGNGTDTCSSVGDIDVWTELHLYADNPGDCSKNPNQQGCFFERAMKKWNGKDFTCKRGRLGGGNGPDDFVQCWGTQCQEEAGTCAMDEICIGTGRDMTGSCSQCGTGDCSCIWGQCLPFPDH